jgi:hypothetical protein
MKKLKTARPIGRIGRNPVIAVRVPPPLHHRITESAKTSGRSMSEEMSFLLARAFEWQQAFGDRVEMLDQAKAEIDRMVRGNLEAEMRRAGWKPLHGTPYWSRPGAAPPSGFVDAAEAAAQLNEIDAAIDIIEAKLTKLKAQRQKKKEA